MAPRYGIGQKVKVKVAEGQPQSLRDSDIQPYAGKVGEITDYYWLNPPEGEVFYIYTMRVESSHKEITLHEDEIEPYLG